MTLKIKCSYVAEGEPFTLGKAYTIYCTSASTGMYYIKDNLGRNVPYRHVDDIPVIDGLVRNLNLFWYSHFTTCNLPKRPEKDIKKEVHELLDKVTELLYNNQEKLTIDYMDFITLVRINEEMK